MEKFHINPETGQVSKCTAKIKCRFGGVGGFDNHYDSADEANKVYNERMNEELGILSTDNDDDRVLKIIKDRYPDDVNIVGYCKIGSYLYNLNEEASDVDYCVIVDKYSKKRRMNQIMQDDLDIKVYPFNVFNDLLSNGKFNEVEILLSGNLKLSDDKYKIYLDHYRHNHYLYLQDLENSKYNVLTQLKKKIEVGNVNDDLEKKQHKIYKDIKKIVRYASLLTKDYKQRDIKYTPVFTDKERKLYFKVVNKYYKKLVNSNEIDIEKLRDDIQNDLDIGFSK